MAFNRAWGSLSHPQLLSLSLSLFPFLSLGKKRKEREEGEERKEGKEEEVEGEVQEEEEEGLLLSLLQAKASLELGLEVSFHPFNGNSRVLGFYGLELVQMEPIGNE